MERVIEIVSFIMKQVLFQGENICSERDLVDALVQQGFQPEEIERAFKLLYSLPTTLKSDIEELAELSDLEEGHRIFSPTEQKKITVTCQGEILRLFNSSLLSLNELEKVLAEALQMDTSEVGLKELEQILYKVIADEERLLMIIPHPIEMGPSFLLN
ncbi:MAG TPA: hypothetical protein DDW65_15750 [Firmicutes bacterium]|nr:hypothetical protein [Bacillota bacterium]